ncbi:winged helix-turn-helix transcriptional regulator [Actinoplanes sp. NPDC049265]|uniref:winged helix-turn-helix transcriptional regulator n=1 Tax=Actinoplanes sp. NPDC049265 TaxID=3363902 RepID=UPI0037239568
MAPEERTSRKRGNPAVTTTRRGDASATAGRRSDPSTAASRPADPSTAASRRSGSSTAAGRRGDLFDPACATRRLLDRIGGKWVAMLVKVLAEASPAELGFAELERRTPGVSHKMLSQTLRSLATDGLVSRRVEPSVPPRVFYRLTPLGLSLDEPLAALRDWAETHMPEIDDFTRRDRQAGGGGSIRPSASPL